MAYTTIDKPDLYFNTLTWTGDGSSSRNITGVGFQPDWVWGKCRNAAVSHAVYDSVRGASNLINTNTTSAEGTNPALNGFISDGFTVNSDSYLNLNNNTYVAWNWKAGTSFTNDASATGIGTIDSTGSVNQDAGFSICSYTGTGSTGTIKHGLNTAPAMIIVKNRSASQNWVVYHQSLGNTKAIFLSTTGAASTGSDWFNNTSPTSTVFSVGTYDAIVGNGHNLIAYCFAEKKGYSKFGSYTGNGNADGTFIYTGFKPAMILLKANAAGENWRIFDNKRSTFNPNSTSLQPNSSNAEASNTDIDFCSNGIKLRTTSGEINPNGTSFIYMAFAESPFVTSTGIPTTTR
jgi:hypothetical protein